MKASLAEPSQATDIESYAERGLRLWAGNVGTHRRETCSCLACADARAWLEARGIFTTPATGPGPRLGEGRCEHA